MQVSEWLILLSTVIITAVMVVFRSGSVQYVVMVVHTGYKPSPQPLNSALKFAGIQGPAYLYVSLPIPPSYLPADSE